MRGERKLVLMTDIDMGMIGRCVIISSFFRVEIGLDCMLLKISIYGLDCVELTLEIALAK